MIENNGQFAHAYLLYGPDENALDRAAIKLIEDALASSAGGITERDKYLIESKTYPDITEIKAEGKNVKIDSIRKVIRFLSLTPQYGDMKFAIIKESQFLSIEAQNAMLKLLEEPLAGRMIIMLADNTDNLLPTTLSRLQKIKISSVNGEESDIIDIDLIEKLTSMLLEGEVEKIFDVSAYMTKDKDKVNDFLMMLYNAFRDIYECKILQKPYKHDCYKESGDNISIKGASEITEIIKDAIKSIRGNASLVICIEAMLISMREVYNAENSRNKI